MFDLLCNSLLFRFKFESLMLIFSMMLVDLRRMINSALSYKEVFEEVEYDINSTGETTFCAFS